MNVRNASFLYLTMHAVDTLGGSLVYTTFAVYLVTVAGLDPFQLVLVGTALEIGYGVFQIPTGVLADTYSRRLAIIGGYLVIGAMFICEGLWPFFGAVLLAEGVRGIGEALFSGANDAWLADEIGAENVGPIMLRNTQVCTVMGFVGAGLAGLLGSIGLMWPFVVGGCINIALAVGLFVVMRETGFSRITGGEHGSMGGTVRGSVRMVRARPVVLTILAVEFFLGAASEGFDRLWEAHFLADIPFPLVGDLKPVAWFSIMSMAGGLVSIGVVEGARRRLKVGNAVAIARTLLILKGLTVIGVIVLALSGDFTLAFAALLVKGVADSLAAPLNTTWLIQNTESAGRATVLSMLGQSNAIGQIAGGPGVGLLGSAVSLRAAIATSGLLLTPTLWLYARVVRRGAPAPIVPDAAIAETETAP